MNIETLLPLIVTFVGNLIGWLALRRKQSEADIEEQVTDVETRKVLNRAFIIQQERLLELDKKNNILEDKLVIAQTKLDAAEAMIASLLEKIGILERKGRKGDTGPLTATPAPQ